MTLCVAWIRETEPNKELVFATDSCLSGGERWNTGIKLFDLPRGDALICFAGRTDRAYPLILNLVSSLRYDKQFQDNSKDIADLALHVCDLFTELVLLITDNSEPIEVLRAGAEFLFGGWSWKKQAFVLLRIFYDTSEKKFVYEDCIDTTKTRKFYFLGDNVEEAKALFRNEFEGERFENLLDMEPLKVLTSMSRDTADYTTIAGALQIAKVYESGHTEFFGVMWPSIEGHPHFLGKKYSPLQGPEVRYFDPDTLALHESPLPGRLTSVSETLFGEDTGFVESCYPAGRLKADLAIHEKKHLFDVLRSAAYDLFLMENSEIPDEPDEERREATESAEFAQADEPEEAAISANGTDHPIENPAHGIEEHLPEEPPQ